MPHFVDRRRIKRQQFLATPSQVYNIYYTESVPVQQLPSIAQNLTKSFPQLGLSASSTSRTRKTPRSSGLFRRNYKTLREKGGTDSLPDFPEECHRRQIANFTMNQLKVQAAELYKNQNFEVQNQNFGAPNAQNQTPFTEYQNDLQKTSMNLNSTRGSPTSVNSSLNSCNRGILNNSSQIITVPTQPMSSSQGYSMKIEVLAQPLQSEDKNSEKLEEDSRNAYEATECMRQKPADQQPQNVISESNYVIPFSEVPIQSTKLIPCMERKNKMSFLTKIVRRIRRESSRTSACVCKSGNAYPGEDLQPEVSIRTIKSPLTLNTGYHNGEGYSPTSSSGYKNSTNDPKEPNKNELNSAQEILSPRQMISSTTNMCSVKTDTQNIEPVESCNETTAFANKEATVSSAEIVNVTPSFQDVMTKLEYTLARYRFESDEERKLFANVITDHLKQHGIKLNIYEQFVTEMIEKEKKKQASRKNRTTLGEFSEKESVDSIKSQCPSHVHVHEKFRNQNIPEARSFASRSQMTQINQTMKQSDNQMSSSSPNTNCKSGASSASYICGSCNCRKPASLLLLDQEEDLHSLKRESIKKDTNIPKDIDDDFYNWKALYEHDVVQNSHIMFDANPDDTLSAYEDGHIKYQHWLKTHSRNGQPSCQKRINGGTSSRNLRSPKRSENLMTSRQHFMSNRHRHREHSPPERDISSKSLYDNNRVHNASLNPSATGFEHIYFDPDTESQRYPPTQNLTCCGLVMYGHNESALSLTQGQCCHRTIPMCGTVSQGVSPRYEPNFVPPYHEHDPCYFRRSLIRAKTQHGHHLHRTDEKKRHYHHHISEYEREEKEESEGSPKGVIDAGLSPPLMLRNLAKGANTVLATIFGRFTGQPTNQERFQPRNRSQDNVVKSKSKRLTSEHAIFN